MQQLVEIKITPSYQKQARERFLRAHMLSNRYNAAWGNVSELLVFHLFSNEH